MARALETVYALALAADLLKRYTPPARAHVAVLPRAGIGSHATEAPRGLLRHHYRTQSDGAISSARIVPPTSQNQKSLEEDLRKLAPQWAELNDQDVSLRCESVIRNYDLCISCSVHFLKLRRS